VEKSTKSSAIPWVKLGLMVLKGIVKRVKVARKLKYKILTDPILYEFTGDYYKGRKIWVLNESVQIEVNEKIYEIPKGFRWDGWSVPSIVRKFFDLNDDPIPALFHDFFYRLAGLLPITQDEADLLLRQIAIDRDLELGETNIAYGWVAISGSLIWNRYKNMTLTERKEAWHNEDITFNFEKE